MYLNGIELKKMNFLIFMKNVYNNMDPIYETTTTTTTTTTKKVLSLSGSGKHDFIF